MTEPSGSAIIEPTSPLYLHPSDGSTSISVEKLTGTTNYRSWRRSLEIGLASKRKLGFVNGTLKRDPSNTVKQEAWDTCNSMIISWILNNVAESIKKSVMFLDSAHAIWDQLEKRFSVVNGARKYQLNRAIFTIKQAERALSEYYIEMKALWEEIESLNALPTLTEISEEAGGALSHSALSTAICSIQGALKDSDWTTRKAASLALGEIASSGGPLMAPFRASCVQALESCRFDKVKPVRETVLQALHCWRSIERKKVPERSDTMSTIKDSPSRDDYGDLVPAGSSMWKDIAQENLKANFVRKRAPVSTRKLCSNFADTSGKSNECEWHVGVAVPKMIPGFPRLLHNDESESSSACKTQETITADVISMQGIGYEYDLSDEKQEYTSVSNHVSDNFTNKFMSSIHRHSGRGDIIMSEGSEKLFLVGKTDVETEKSHNPKMEDRKSLDSTVTEAEECHSVRVYCSQRENEISSIRKQLLEIEKKQSNLMDLFQGFAMSTMDTLSVIQSKVSSLEHAVDKIAHDVHVSKYNDLASMRHHENGRSIDSPRISNTSPKPSVDMQDRTSERPSRNNEIWEGKAVVIKSKSNSISPCLDSQRRPLSMVNRNFTGHKTDTAHDLHSTSYRQNIKNDWVNPSTSPSNARHRGRVKENGICKQVKDIDSAYREALYSGDQLLLIELIDGTGPVLDRLSNETINNLFTALASYVVEHRIIESIYPWLQQVVDLSGIHGPNCVPLSMKVRREILSALQEALDVDVTHPTKRRMVAQLAMKLQQIWG